MSFRKIPSIALIIGAFMVLLLIVNHPSSAAENSLDEPDKIYVSDLGARTMLRMGMDGTQVETLFELPEETGPLAVVLDPARERMYYIDRQREYRHIYSADMEGQDRQELPVPFGHYNTLALDHGSSRLLWTQIEAIGESDFDGADAAFQLHPGPVDPGDIVVDEVNDLLYWSGQKSGIFSSHFDGSSTVVIKDNEWLTTITVDAPAGETWVLR